MFGLTKRDMDDMSKVGALFIIQGLIYEFASLFGFQHFVMYAEDCVQVIVITILIFASIFRIKILHIPEVEVVTEDEEVTWAD